MKALPYVNTILLAIASVLLPQLGVLLEAYQWAHANLTSWFCSKKVGKSVCQNV